MAFRQIELIIPKDHQEDVSSLLEENDLVIDFWHDEISKGNISVKIIVQAEKSQNVIDSIDEKFSTHEEFRLMVHNLEAVSPHPEQETEEKKQEETKEEETETASISREELYSTLSDKSELSIDYLILISLASIVASIGVLRNEIAVIIGAMVIAPMVGPNMGLSLSTTLADPVLGKESLRTIFLGILAAFLISAAVGFFLYVDPNIPFIVSRTEAGIADVALALAAGSAGAIAFTRDVATALIGVMVSISLLPTLVVSGLLIGTGNLVMGGSAMLLFLINLTCINLSGVLTFLIEGIKPRSWWKADKAKRMSRWATIIWVLLLVALVAVLVFTQWF